jgi:hypothetical protein
MLIGPVMLLLVVPALQLLFLGWRGALPSAAPARGEADASA